MKFKQFKNIFLVSLLSLCSLYAGAADDFENNIVKALEADQLVEAKALFSKLTKIQKNSLTGILLQSRLLFRADETEESYDLLAALAEDNKQNADVYYYFGRSAVVMAQKVSIFSKLGYASDALEAWQHALTINPKHKKTLEGIISFHLGAPSIAGGDVEQALTYSQALIPLDAEKGYASLARVYWKKEQNDLAEQAILDGLSITPNSGHLFYTQGLAYSRQAEDDNAQWQKSRDAFSLALKNAKTDKEKQHTLYQIGKMAVNSGEEINIGIEALEQLITLDSKQYHEWAQYRLAELYLNDKQLLKAKNLISSVNYQDDDELKGKVKSLAKKIKKAVKKRSKVS